MNRPGSFVYMHGQCNFVNFPSHAFPSFLVPYIQGHLSPLTPWSKFPLPFPFSLPSPPLPSPPVPLEVGPLIAAKGSGERFSSPSGSRRSPAAKRYLVNFRLKISPLVATIFRSFSEINQRFCRNLRGGECINN